MTQISLFYENHPAHAQGLIKEHFYLIIPLICQVYDALNKLYLPQGLFWNFKMRFIMNKPQL